MSFCQMVKPSHYGTVVLQQWTPGCSDIYSICENYDITFVKLLGFEPTLEGSSQICSDNWAARKLGVNNCLISPFMTEFN